MPKVRCVRLVRAGPMEPKILIDKDDQGVAVLRLVEVSTMFTNCEDSATCIT